VITFSPPPLSKRYSKGCQNGDVPPSVWSHRQEFFWHVTGREWPQVDCKVTCNQRWKAFYSILIHWEVAAVWYQFWWEKKQHKMVVFRNFEMSPVAMVTLRLNMLLQRLWSSQHLCQIWTWNRRLFNENDHFSQYAHEVKS
jgi:hypothetical protein